MGGKMLKGLNKRIKKVIAISVIAIGGITSTNTVFASNDNIDFVFQLQPNYGNSYSAARYRQTTYNNNPWKVNLQYSSEGNGTLATFWLDVYGVMGSNTYNVKQGTGDWLFMTNDNADETNVRLGAENNNLTPNTYNIAGKWDEETW